MLASGHANSLSKAKRLVAESGLFAVSHYRAQEPKCTERDALDHYLSTGWQDGLDPALGFSTIFYLSTYPDVAEQGINPLVHYLEFGRDEGRRPVPDDRGERPAERLPPTLADWREIARRYRASERIAVDVVVPVFRAYGDTLRCLHAVLTAPQRTPFRLVVVYDDGPVPALHRTLVRLWELGLIDLIQNQTNQGFVRSTNIGLARHPDRDAILLNSDTLPHNDWLDRLRRAAYSGDRIATATPFSNNAEICSYPVFVADNNEPLEIDDPALDRLFAETNRHETMEIPTGVGFCMYVRRDALDALGPLAERHFGRGYGEEVDFCCRAREQGWTNLLAADVFVRHVGGLSFGAEKTKLVEASIAKVEYLHPGYIAEIHRFVRHDPIRPLRVAIDEARLQRRLASRDATLFVLHARGGGTERHAGELAARLDQAGMAVLFCRPAPDGRDRIEISHPDVPHLPNLPAFDLGEGPTAFAAFLEGLRVVHLHIHHLVDFDTSASDFFRKTARLLGRAYDVTIHDYFFVCPRINLIDRSGYYCGEPDIRVCEECTQHDDMPIYGRQGVWEWRERTGRLLGDARNVYVPNEDVARRFARYVPDRTFLVRPHFGEEVAAKPRPRRPAAAASRGRKLAIIGAIGPEKGSELLLACARAALSSHPELSFEVVGHTDRDADFASLDNVRVSGRYREADLPRLLAASEADAAWFPSIWPETFSYALSAALAAGIMPVAFDFGAMADRIREVGWGYLVPPSCMLRPEVLIEHLAGFDIGAPPQRIRTGTAYPDIARDYYGGLPGRMETVATGMVGTDTIRTDKARSGKARAVG